MKKHFSIPNLLSTFRILLIPVFVLAFFLVNQTPNYVALSIFALAIITDAVDGFIARKFNMITDLGKVLDPLADKLLKISTLVCFAVVGTIPFWALLVLLVLDLVLIFSASVLLRREIIIKSNFLGKSGTVVIFAGLILAFFADSMNHIHMHFLIVGMLIVFLSIISYLMVYLKIKNKSPHSSVSNKS